MNNFVTCYFAGRLGNQMFQIANVYAQALRHNRAFKLPVSNNTGDTPLTYKDGMFRKLEFCSRAHVAGMHHIAGTYYYTDYKPHETLPTAFAGYYQSEKFFKDYSENIICLFESPKIFIEKAHQDYPQIAHDNTVAIHVRRGDFTIQTSRFPLVTKEYITEALKQIPNKTYCFVLSDDILWCKENIKGENIIFTNYTNPCQALWFMSLCKNFVISNSTFSWWGAYLGKEKNKKVIHPSLWFGPSFDVSGLWNPKDVYCPEWISIPTVYTNPGLIMPC